MPAFLDKPFWTLAPFTFTLLSPVSPPPFTMPRQRTWRPVAVWDEHRRVAYFLTDGKHPEPPIPNQNALLLYRDEDFRYWRDNNWYFRWSEHGVVLHPSKRTERPPWKRRDKWRGPNPIKFPT